MANDPTVIYAFGDSLSDSGDAYLLTSSAYAAQVDFSTLPVDPPYYQENYPAIGGGTLTADVSSNGPVWVQDLAGTLGIASPAPGQIGATASEITAALQAQNDPAGAISSFIGSLEAAQDATGSNPYLLLVSGAAGGTDFAVGGSVTGQTDFNTSAATTLTDLANQVTNFESEVPAPAAGALYTVWSGINDVLNLWESPGIATQINSGAAAVYMAQSASAEVAAVLRLVAGGADDVLVLNVPDVGTLPAALGTGPTTDVIATQLGQMFNGDLAGDLAAANFGTASVKLADSFSLYDSMIADPGAYKLSNVTDPVYSGPSTSFISSDLVSADPKVQDGYLFFDAIHPTSTGHQAIAALADAALACFAAGTRILTVAGELPVEALREGDQVVLASGRVAPVRWLGHRHVDCRRHPRPRDVWPIRVRAGAFGANLPHRDLLLSPDHAVYLSDADDDEGVASGILVPVRFLMNGATVVQEPVEAITYWHVELPTHDVLLAEGLPAESYLDTGNRGSFANCGAFPIRVCAGGG